MKEYEIECNLKGKPNETVESLLKNIIVVFEMVGFEVENITHLDWDNRELVVYTHFKLPKKQTDLIGLIWQECFGGVGKLVTNELITYRDPQDLEQ